MKSHDILFYSGQSLFNILITDGSNVQIQGGEVAVNYLQNIFNHFKIQSVLFFSARLSQRESGWAIFPPKGVWIMHRQQKHERSSEGVRGAMTHRVSSYTSQRCSDWSCGEQNDWVTTYHKTTPNQFQIKLAAALISVKRSFYMLHYCGAHWISLNKIYRTRCSPDVSLLYSEGINFTFSQELLELHRQLLKLPFAQKIKIISLDTFLATVRQCKRAISRAIEWSQISFIHHFFIQQYNFSEYNQYKMYMTKYILNRTEDLKAFQ